METDQLIRSLAADNAHRGHPVGFVLAPFAPWQAAQVADRALPAAKSWPAPIVVATVIFKVA